MLNLALISSAGVYIDGTDPFDLRATGALPSDLPSFEPYLRRDGPGGRLQLLESLLELLEAPRPVRAGRRPQPLPRPFLVLIMVVLQEDSARQ